MGQDARRTLEMNIWYHKLKRLITFTKKGVLPHIWAKPLTLGQNVLPLKGILLRHNLKLNYRL